MSENIGFLGGINLRTLCYLKEFKKNGINKLRDQLEQLDPIHFNKIDNKNPQRIIRAIEVCKITNKPYSSLLTKSQKIRPFKTIKIFIGYYF